MHPIRITIVPYYVMGTFFGALQYICIFSTDRTDSVKANGER